MNAKHAIVEAKRLFEDLFSSEPITEIGLEEVDYSEPQQAWKITIGFARRAFPMNRWYKVITIKDSDGALISIRNRDELPV